MKNGIQTFYKAIGDYACLILCMIKIAEMHTGMEFDPISVIMAALKNGWIEKDMFVSFPEKIMEYLTGEKWTYMHSASPVPEELRSTYLIERWEWNRPDGSSNHFRLKDWDSLENSQTVKNGSIASYRILKKLY